MVYYYFMFRRVYFDNAATTPVDPSVLDAMLPFFSEKYGNPSSIHYFGQESRAAIDRARHQVAKLINSKPGEIVFTSGGTESNNLGIRGYLEANRQHGNHIVISAIEHPAVEALCADLERSGYLVSTLPVYEDGVARIEDIGNSLRNDTILISVMTANNEIGTIQPIEAIGKLVADARRKGKRITFHTDAVQAVGKIDVDVERFNCDLLSLSGHKIYAPKGIGALFVRRGIRLHSQNLGGRQERDRRGGTESVPLIAGFGKACERARLNAEKDQRHLENLRNAFEKGVIDKMSDFVFNGNCQNRLPNISNISFDNVDGEALLINLDLQGIAVSTGSACSSGSIEPSPILRALGLTDSRARGAVRFSFGKDNLLDEIDYLLGILPKVVENLRKLSTA